MKPQEDIKGGVAEKKYGSQLLDTIDKLSTGARAYVEEILKEDPKLKSLLKKHDELDKAARGEGDEQKQDDFFEAAVAIEGRLKRFIRSHIDLMFNEKDSLLFQYLRSEEGKEGLRNGDESFLRQITELIIPGIAPHDEFTQDEIGFLDYFVHENLSFLRSRAEKESTDRATQRLIKERRGLES